MYLHGIGTKADEKLAEKYLLKAEDYGNVHAAYQLAKLYIIMNQSQLLLDASVSDICDRYSFTYRTPA